MTAPGDDIQALPTAQVMAMTKDFRAMLRVIEAVGLGGMTVGQLLDSVERLAQELEVAEGAAAELDERPF